MSPILASLLVLGQTSYKTEGAPLDFVSEEFRLPIVSVEVGGDKRRLLLDTGSAMTTLVLGPEFNSSVIISTDVEVSLAGNSVKLDIARRHLPGIDYINRIGKEPVDGVLGADFLERFKVGLDLGNARLALWPRSASTRAEALWFGRYAAKPGGPPKDRPSDPVASAPRHEVVSLRMARKSDPRMRVDGRIGRYASTRFLLDTGSAITLVSSERRGLLDQFEAGEARVIQEALATESGKTVRVPSLDIGAKFNLPLGVTLLPTPGDEQNVIGVDVLQQASFFMDFRDNTAKCLVMP